MATSKKGAAVARYRRLLLTSDLLALALACLCGIVVGQQSGRPEDTQSLVLAALIALPFWALFAYGAGLYHRFERRVQANAIGDFLTLAVVSTAWIWVLLLIRAGLFPDPADLTSSAVVWLALLVLAPLGRVVARVAADRLAWTAQKTALLGDRMAIEGMVDRIGRHPEWRIAPVAVVEIVGTPGQEEPAGAPHLPGSPSLDPAASLGNGNVGCCPVEHRGQIIEFLGAKDVTRVILAGGFGGYRDLAQRTRFLHELLISGYSVDLVAGGPETVFSGSIVHDYEGVPVINFQPVRRRKLSLVVKRVLDVVFAVTGLLVMAPVLAWAAFQIRRDSDGPVLFRQVRWGQDGREFEMVKLRTMIDDAEGMKEDLREKSRDHGNDDVLFKLKDDPRITPIGRSLRCWSIDELPQLWNVLKGEMSMVGPRPLVPDEAAQAEQVVPGRSSVKPGVAGPWQALGRSEIPFDGMVRLDLAYVLGSSTIEDLRLLFQTTAAVIRRRGAM